MTLFEPTLALSRLVVTKAGQAAFDERFQYGVNVLRGDNSTGKSTIADFIFFALGGDISTWKTEAALCDTTMAEVEINGAKVTLRREITSKSMQPMAIFFGGYEEASASATTGWQRYAFARGEGRESFSQVLFRLMKMPTVAGDAGANITMHQLLRLMYVDQMTPPYSIFRFERFDSSQRKEAVGDLLCGVYDERIYAGQLRLRALKTELETAIAQLSGIYRVLDRAQQDTSLDLLIARANNARHEHADQLAYIEELRRRRLAGLDVDPEAKKTLVALQADLARLNKDTLDQEQRLNARTFEIEDAEQLILETQRSLRQLDQGREMRRAIGHIAFSFCPSCFGLIEPASSDDHCALCKQPIKEEGYESRLLRVRNELEIQLKESEQLQKERKTEQEVLSRRHQKMVAMRDAVASQYAQLTRNFVSEIDTEIEAAIARAGYLAREIEELARQSQLLEQLRTLSEQKAKLTADIATLEDDLKRWQQERNRRQEQAYGLIRRITARILALDLKHEEEFGTTNDIYFDFGEDKIAVGGKSQFSASSLTILRNSFHLALLAASATDQSFRYPRFLLMDNIEDKGMQRERSHNFQRIIFEASKQLQAAHQIIFTTSMPSEETEASGLTVGPKFTFERKSLRIG